ncbi:hypothetical protein J7I98_36020 [Streptomyces sp. ISL-98]|uniref:terpene synthase family protein n=1 Tax=Streptomyces sp. ISL-98 TaxID=2819192 RepID=UPI001BEB66E5|nr:terpene synthase family protein [Streptomyces sp. ISL-98]MBT2511132.1 hypothetical protein [Streptomyces sp. ISL-98]
MLAKTSPASAIGWQLPPFYCPLADVGVHPAAGHLDEQALAWADEFGLYPDATERAWARAIHNADFVGRVIPVGNAETLLLFIEWNYWAWAIDDWHDSGTGTGRTADVTDHSIRVLRSLEAPGSAMLAAGPLNAALSDLVERTRAMFTPSQLHQLCVGARDWLYGASWQTANAERRIMPTLNDFAAVRISINGTRFSLAFSETANGIRLPPDVQYSPSVQALTDAAGFIVSCDNDLFSYALDDHNDPPSQNLVNVLAHHTGRTPKEALPTAVAIRDRAMTLFVNLREQLAQDADVELRRYLDALGNYISGCIRWMCAAPRYASPRNRNALPVPGAYYDITWRDTPSDAATEPLNIPAVSWWWKQLT